MTEHDWLVSQDPKEMLWYLTQESGWELQNDPSNPIVVQSGRAWVIPREKPLISDRQARMFACACCRIAGADPGAVDDYEKFGILDDDGKKCFDLEWANQWAGDWGSKKVTQTEKAHLLRDIVGNPYQPWSSCRTPDGRMIQLEPGGRFYRTINPVWLTPTVTALAQGIYERGEWDLMPILADALEEAWCTDEAVLQHCRGMERCSCLGVPRKGKGHPFFWKCPMCDGAGWIPLRGPHVRGCHVVDLISGKE